MAIHWKAVEQYFTVVLFVFQFYPISNFGKFINFGLGTIRSERVNVPVGVSTNMTAYHEAFPFELQLRKHLLIHATDRPQYDCPKEGCNRSYTKVSCENVSNYQRFL